MKTKTFYYFLFFLFVSVLFFSCKKEEALPFAKLNFQVVNVANGLYACTWDASNISTFKNYYIVHSPFILGIDDDPKNNFYERKSTISGQTRDNVVLSVNNINGLPLYFQLFVDIGDRYIRSEVLPFETPKSKTIDIAAASALHYPEKNAIYLLNFGLNELNYYDIGDKEIKEKVEVDFPFNSFTAQVGNNGFGEEIYAIDGNDLIIFDAETLEEKDKYSTNGVIYSVTTNDNGLIAITVRKSGNSIQILSRENLTLLNNLSSFNSYNEPRGIAFLSKENNELIEVGKDYSKYFKLDADGIVVESSYAGNPFDSPGINEIITVSPSGNYYVYSKRGQIFDSEMNGIKDLLSTQGNSYSSYFFNKEETFLYAILSGVSGNFIDKFSIPNFEWVGRKEFANGSSLELFYQDNEIQLVRFTDDFRCTFIYPLNF